MPKPKKPISLALAFGMEPKDAVAYFESKGYKITADWQDMWQAAHAKAFTVAGVAKMDVLEDIRGAVTQALKEGQTEKWFAKQLTPILQQKGWWGVTSEIDDAGNVFKTRMGNPARLKLIYRMNTRNAYHAGRYKEQLANADLQPWWQYVAVMDQKTRDTHGANHLAVYRHDDPFWLVWYPLNGWNCRCRVETLSDSMVQRRGITPLSGEGRMVEAEVESIHASTGEVTMRTVKGIRLTDPNTGIERTVYTGVGFSHNPAAAAFGTDMELARKLSLVEDSKLYSSVIQAMNNCPLRQQNFALEMQQIITSQKAGKECLAVALVEKEIARFVRAQGCNPATILVLPEKQALHALRKRHVDAGIALTDAEAMNLPYMVANAEMVLWDIEHSSVVYAYPDADPTKRIIIAAEMPAQGKRKKTAEKLDAVVNFYRTPVRNLQDENKYLPIQ